MNQVWVPSISKLLFQLFLTQKVRNESQERFTIRKYAAINGPTAAAKKIESKSRPVNESTVRGFCAMYKAELEKARKEKRPIAPNLNVLPRKHPLLLESLDQMVQKFLLALRSRGSLINPHLELDHIDLDSSSWAKSLFRRMGFKKRMKTTGKIEIPNGAKKEAQLLYSHDIVSLVDDLNIPHSLILNLDQTKLKYIPSTNHTLARKGSKSIGIAGSDDK